MWTNLTLKEKVGTILVALFFIADTFLFPLSIYYFLYLLTGKP